MGELQGKYMCPCLSSIYCYRAHSQTEFGKNYPDEKEEQMRKKIFTETLLSIEEHNKKFERGEVTFSMGINNFSDQTPEERARSRGFRLPSIEKK